MSSDSARETTTVVSDVKQSLPQVLVITPKQTLVFRGTSSQSANVPITLHNPSQKLVAFKVKTTAPKRYCVRPNGGLIKPGETISVSIIYQPTGDNSDAQERSRHKFLVQAIFVESADAQQDQAVLWRDVPKDRIMESKIRCMFEDSEEMSQENRQPEGAVYLSSSAANQGADMDHSYPRASMQAPAATDTSGIDRKELEYRRLGEDYRRAQDEIANLRDEIRLLRDNGDRMRKTIQNLNSTTSLGSISSGSGSRQNLSLDWKTDLTKPYTLGAIMAALIMGVIISQILF